MGCELCLLDYVHAQKINFAKTSTNLPHCYRKSDKQSVLRVVVDGSSRSNNIPLFCNNTPLFCNNLRLFCNNPSLFKNTSGEMKITFGETKNTFGVS